MIRGARDTQLASLAEPARIPGRSDVFGAGQGGILARSCRIEGVACARTYAQLCITFHDSARALTSRRQLLRKVLIYPHRARSPIRRSTAWCCWAKAAECRLPCYAAPLVWASGDAGWLTRPEHGPVGLAGAGRASDARWVAQLWLLPDVLVRLAGDGGGAPAPRWSAQALSTRQRGEGPRVG